VSATPATTALTAAGVWFRLHSYHNDPRAAGYATEAADALGLDPERVFKTLLAMVSGLADPAVVALVPASAKLDLKALAEAAGGKRATMAAPADAERLTGYVVGGISPLGQRRRLPTFVDSVAELWDTVFVSGGRRGLEIEVAPADLVALTAATVADLAT
jgi:Cys-tRNA(Pro)/Cys-tRNA(Cys) deacylase